MNEDTAPTHGGLLAAAAFLAFGGGLGLILLVTLTLPTLGPRWLFFVLWVMTLTGVAVPFVRYLNRRFARRHVPPAVMLREAIFVALFGAAVAWLQISRALTLPLTLLLAAGLLGVDLLLRLREGGRRDVE